MERCIFNSSISLSAVIKRGFAVALIAVVAGCSNVNTTTGIPSETATDQNPAMTFQNPSSYRNPAIYENLARPTLSYPAMAAEATSFNTSCQLPDSGTLRSVVRILNETNGKSSGVVIAPNRVLTVLHALDMGGKNYAVINGQRQPAEALAFNEQHDLVLLKTDTGSLPAMPLSKRPLNNSEFIWAIGYPLGGELRTSLGVVKQSNERRIYSSAHINSGTSGGALLRCSAVASNEFELAGIVRAYLADTRSGKPINIGESVAVSHHVIRRLLNSAGNSIAMLSD